MLQKILFSLICIHSAAAVSFAYTMSSKVEDALRLMIEGNTEDSIKHFKTAAGTNDMTAQYYLGQCYEFGIGVDIDPEAAFSMYRRAAERGFPPAMKELARCYRDGVGVASNRDRAYEWQNRFEKKQFQDAIPKINELYQLSLSQINVKNQNSEDTVSDKEDTQSTNLGGMTTQAKPSVENVHLLTPPQQATTPTPTNISDVDTHIPTIGEIKDNVFALIIANENYQDVAPVKNALNDGVIMAEYCNKVLGIPNSNIHLIKDATLNNIKREINLFSQIATAYNGEASFIIYYAGHGIPDEKTHDAYLMPVDGFSTDISTCFSLADLYKTFGEMPIQKNIILMDACFSGSTRGTDMLYSARSIKLRPKKASPSGKTIVISSAQGDETAFPYEEQNHGLFTYYLLKKLKETKGDVTIGELFNYVKENVGKKSLVINKKSQTPAISASYEVAQNWNNWKIN